MAKMHNLHLETTPLCELAMKYHSDKCPRLGHCYTPIYYNLFRDKRNSVQKVLEMGIGLESYRTKNPHYIVGAGLRMWRDFFPGAQIFGADIERESLFTEDRVQTFYCDNRNPNNLRDLINQTGNDIDIVIDDASHHIHDQVFLLRNLMPLLNKKVTYFMEDCYRPNQMLKMIKEYHCEVPEMPQNDGPERGSLLVFTYK